MEFVAYLFRALANRSRIRILRLLGVLGQMNVAQIAQATAIELGRTSAHLKVLAAVGLIWRCRSGRVVGYHLAERPGHPVTAAALQVLRRVFRAVTATDSREVAHADQVNSTTCSDAALFACFTAFTHPRRLQIIRHLARERTATSRALASALSMSASALHRHLEKLERRGLVRARVMGRRATYALTQGTGAVQVALLKAVREHLLAMGG